MAAVLSLLPLVARMAAAGSSYVVLILLTRRTAARVNPEIGVCLLQLPLLQQLISFFARGTTFRTAARCSSALSESQQQQRQSSYNLSYMSVVACCFVSLLLVPIWLFLLQPQVESNLQLQPSDPQQQHQLAAAAFGAAAAYPPAVAAFAASGLLESVAEVLSLRCLLRNASWARGSAEAVATVSRSLLLALVLYAQKAESTTKALTPTAEATSGLLLSPLTAYAISQICSSLLYVLVLWLQCCRLGAAEAAARAAAAEDTKGASTSTLIYVLLAAWPPFQPLAATAAAASSSAKTGAANTGGATTPASPLSHYLSEDHLRLLPTNVLLLLQKLLLENGEQLLMLMLLDAVAAAEYALVSGAASVLCRVVYAPVEAAALEAFCSLQTLPAVGFSLEADAAAANENSWNSSSPVWISKKRQQNVGQRLAGCLVQQQQQLKSKQPIGNSHRGGIKAETCSTEGVSETPKARVLVPGLPPRLLRLLGKSDSLDPEAEISTVPPALLVLRLLLLLQGSLGLAAAAGGYLFGCAALRCVFGPTAVSPGGRCVEALQM